VPIEAPVQDNAIISTEKTSVAETPVAVGGERELDKY